LYLLSEKYVCEAGSSFAFKALQKEYPFITLSIIFVLTCVCFGFSLRIFELYYWETQAIRKQDWTYEWNAVWCIFVSMTTVGYGDFYPKTHAGRFIVIIACIVGIYFVSMMMVFMTQKSILNETEYKAYKLITRLKLRKEIKDFQSQMIFHCMKMNKLKKKLKYSSNDKETEIQFNYEKRCIISLIEKIKSKYRTIKTFEFIPTKEQLFDVCERIDTDIKEIKQEIEALKFINDEVINYTDSQIEVVKYLKKNIYATRLMYSLIAQAPIFGKLNNVDQTILYEDDYMEKGSESDERRTKRSMISGLDKTRGEVSKEDLGKTQLSLPKYNNHVISEEAENTLKPRMSRNFIEKMNQNINESNNIMAAINEMNNFNSNNNLNVPDNTQVQEKDKDREDEKYFKDNSQIERNSNDQHSYVLDKDMASKDIILNYNVSAEEIKSHFEYLFLNPQKCKSKEKKTANLLNKYNFDRHGYSLSVRKGAKKSNFSNKTDKLDD
jgi:hypothetical protein